jgi:hypothetical protein
MRNVSVHCCRENQNTYFMPNKIFFENRAVCNVEKYCKAGQATDENMVHAQCTLGA